MDVFNKYESNVRSYIRSFPAVFEFAKGSTLTDENGRDYIDFFSGAGAVNYGHNNDYIKEKLIRYLSEDRILHSLDMGATAKREFIEFYEENILKPRGFDYKIQFPGPTGANAVEAALKIARKATGRTGIFALMGAFHGMTLGSLACTTDADSRAGAGIDLSGVTHLPAPYMFPEMDTLKYYETLLTDDHSGVAKPAAFIIEAVQVDGGVYPLPAEWLQGVRALCDKYGILMIIDDIQAGADRCGRYFSFEYAGIVPDIVTVSKSAGGYGLPFAMTLMKPEIDVLKPGEHTGTFRGNQLAFVAAKAGIEYYLANDMDNEVCRKGALVREFLEKEIAPLDSRLQIRGIGLLWGIDFNAMPDPEISRTVMQKCFANCLVAERAGRGNNVLKIMPPLVIEDAQLLQGLEILRNVMKEVLA